MRLFPLLALGASAHAASKSCPTNINAVVPALKANEIIPLIIPSAASFTPSVFLSIEYPQSGTNACLGNELIRNDTLLEPVIKLTGKTHKEGASYTLAMLDPDAPSKVDPKYGQFRHWVITGLKKGRQETVAMKTKPSTTLYRPPGPGAGSGVHRYAFLLFEEPGKNFTVPEGAPEYGSELEQRRNWDAYAFGEKYGLKLVAANYFLLRSDV